MRGSVDPIGEQLRIERPRRDQNPIPDLPVALVRSDEPDGGQRVQMLLQAPGCEAERSGKIPGESRRLRETEIDLCPLPVLFCDAASREAREGDLRG